MKIAAIVLVSALVALAATLAIASNAWTRGTRREEARLRRGALEPSTEAAGGGGADAAGAGAALPPPVARFLARALPADGRTIRLATVRQEGEFLLRAPDGWAPFSATQLFRAEPPGFLWDARIRMAPLVHVRVRDGYRDGTGSMHGAVAGLVTVVRASGTPELASGSLYRFLAEAAWIPTRLRPSRDLRWDAMDESTATATLTDGGTSVAVQFRFDAGGDIVGIHVPERARQVDGGYELAPWTGRFWGHREIGGFRIPTRGEVAWVIEGEEQPYWKGRIVEVVYDDG